jgi:pimeloyl-ACP methyl ester carboxylesterase
VAAFVDACIPEPDSEHLRRWGRQILLRADSESAARILEVHAEEHIAPAAEDLQIPTLIINGEHDLIIPVEEAQSLRPRHERTLCRHAICAMSGRFGSSHSWLEA